MIGMDFLEVVQYHVQEEHFVLCSCAPQGSTQSLILFFVNKPSGEIRVNGDTGVTTITHMNCFTNGRPSMMGHIKNILILHAHIGLHDTQISMNGVKLCGWK